MIKKSNKLPMEVILVATGDQALAVGSFQTAGNSVNIANGALGVMSYDPNSAVQPIGDYLLAGDDSNEVQAIRIVQGTPASANTLNADIWEVGDKSHIETGTIRKNQIKSVAVKKYVPGTLGAAAVTAFPTPVNDVEYLMYLKLDSTRLDKEYSTMNDAAKALNVDRKTINFRVESKNWRYRSFYLEGSPKKIEDLKILKIDCPCIVDGINYSSVSQAIEKLQIPMSTFLYRCESTEQHFCNYEFKRPTTIENIYQI